MNKNPPRADKTYAWPFVRWIKERHRWQVDARTKDGGQRRFFEKKTEAEGWASAQVIKRDNEGSSAFDEKDLRAFGWSVADAIKFALTHLRNQAASVPLESAVNALIEAKKGAGRSDRYCNDLRLRLGRLCAAFEDKTVGQNQHS